MSAKTETWCGRDEHNLFEHYADFNKWLESDEGTFQIINGLNALKTIIAKI